MITFSNSIITPHKRIWVMMLLLFSACGSEDMELSCPDDFSFQAEIKTQLEFYEEAAIAFANEPSSANCNVFRASGDNLLDRLEDIRECAINVGFSQNYVDIRDQVISSIAQLSC